MIEIIKWIVTYKLILLNKISKEFFKSGVKSREDVEVPNRRGLSQKRWIFKYYVAKLSFCDIK